MIIQMMTAKIMRPTIGWLLIIYDHPFDDDESDNDNADDDNTDDYDDHGLSEVYDHHAIKKIFVVLVHI